MSNAKPFKMQYRAKSTGQMHLETPRYMVSVDGTEHSLVVGSGADETVLAQAPRSETADGLWQQARAWIIARQ